MSRSYIQLECGCLISCDGGGGLMPCDSKECKALEYTTKHKLCQKCGECIVCFPDHKQSHGKTWDYQKGEYVKISR